MLGSQRLTHDACRRLDERAEEGCGAADALRLTRGVFRRLNGNTRGGRQRRDRLLRQQVLDVRIDLVLHVLPVQDVRVADALELAARLDEFHRGPDDIRQQLRPLATQLGGAALSHAQDLGVERVGSGNVERSRAAPRRSARGNEPFQRRPVGHPALARRRDLLLKRTFQGREERATEIVLAIVGQPVGQRLVTGPTPALPLRRFPRAPPGTGHVEAERPEVLRDPVMDAVRFAEPPTVVPLRRGLLRPVSRPDSHAAVVDRRDRPDHREDLVDRERLPPPVGLAAPVGLCNGNAPGPPRRTARLGPSPPVAVHRTEFLSFEQQLVPAGGFGDIKELAPDVPLMLLFLALKGPELLLLGAHPVAGPLRPRDELVEVVQAGQRVPALGRLVREVSDQEVDRLPGRRGRARAGLAQAREDGLEPGRQGGPRDGQRAGPPRQVGDPLPGGLKAVFEHRHLPSGLL